MSEISKVIPHIPSEDMEKTCSFLTTLFELERHEISEVYIELSAEQTMLGVLSSHGTPNEQSIYIRVSDLEVVWSRVKGELVGISNKVPFNQPYGMREFHVVIPGTKTLLFVGQPLSA